MVTWSSSQVPISHILPAGSESGAAYLVFWLTQPLCPSRVKGEQYMVFFQITNFPGIVRFLHALASLELRLFFKSESEYHIQFLVQVVLLQVWPAHLWVNSLIFFNWPSASIFGANQCKNYPVYDFSQLCIKHDFCQTTFHHLLLGLSSKSKKRGRVRGKLV